MKNTKTFVEGGINEEFIEKIGEFPENVLRSLECCICRTTFILSKESMQLFLNMPF